MVTELVEKKALEGIMYPNTMVSAFHSEKGCMIVQYIPEQSNLKEKIKAAVNYVDNHATELLLGTAILGSLAVVTSGAAIPILLVSWLVVVSW
ncbi:hypothetical protein IJ182_03540 [bacterium]|nr:hypothetical protein [bacterium]